MRKKQAMRCIVCGKTEEDVKNFFQKLKYLERKVKEKINKEIKKIIETAKEERDSLLFVRGYWPITWEEIAHYGEFAYLVLLL